MVGRPRLVNTPTESVPSPALSTRSNLTATLWPDAPRTRARRPTTPTAAGPAFWRTNVSPSPYRPNGASSPTWNQNEVLNPRTSTGAGAYALPAWYGPSVSRSRSPVTWADPFRSGPPRRTRHRSRTVVGRRARVGTMNTVISTVSQAMGRSATGGQGIVGLDGRPETRSGPPGRCTGRTRRSSRAPEHLPGRLRHPASGCRTGRMDAVELRRCRPAGTVAARGDTSSGSRYGGRCSD